LSDFDEKNWTSSLRTHAGFSSYREGPSDFFYFDEKGLLARWLGLDEVPRMFLIEVKSSTGADSRNFYWSPKQFILVLLAPASKVR